MLLTTSHLKLFLDSYIFKKVQQTDAILLKVII